ncbi:hypothetical protein DF186_11085 [Enterococcus hirae]|uniref:hypothetical protein n=1 Tax=Enterococcus hirae TaxID=1354 RepID=UPI000B9FBE82|nr:hypothetical protein [Enterococcus hirae]OZS41063.1 hypothetical protein CHB54_00775 [Enterococcus hirae]PWG75784.1 hypothetical protein DF186_11085 [Enterococcus hirae]
MEWLNNNQIEKKIRQVRNENFGNECSWVVDQNIQYILNEISILRDKGKNLFAKENQNLMIIIPKLLKIEAKVLNLVEIASYEKFQSERDAESYLIRESKFSYVDYLRDIDYVAEDFEDISFLAKFCVQEKR